MFGISGALAVSLGYYISPCLRVYVWHLRSPGCALLGNPMMLSCSPSSPLIMPMGLSPVLPLGSGPIWRFQACSLLPTVLSSDYSTAILWASSECKSTALCLCSHHACSVLVMTLFFHQHPPTPQMSAVINQPRFHSQFNCFFPWTPIHCVHIYISLSGHFVLR